MTTEYEYDVTTQTVEQDSDSMTYAERIARVMKAYDVPIDLRRYDTTYMNQ